MRAHDELNRRKGFTLLGLLVVIAIIGLLSSIVISAVSNARTQARNTAINSSMIEYSKAFAIYYSTAGSYPTPATEVPTPTKCLGGRSPCGSMLYVGGALDTGSPTAYTDAQLDAEVATVYPSAPSFERILSLSLGGVADFYFAGPTYFCELYAGSRCVSVTLMWYLSKTDQKCPAGATPTTNGLGTECRLYLR